jgi:hypothetical protein
MVAQIKIHWYVPYPVEAKQKSSKELVRYEVLDVT